MTIRFQAKTLQGWTVDSPLKALTFPDGAVHITGADAETEYQYQIADVRGMSHDDLFTLAMWGNACDNRGEDKVLILPYLPGARMDRGLPNSEGAAVYAWFILNDINPQHIITIDPHSPGATSFYDLYARDGRLGRLTVFPVERIIRKEIQDPTQDTHADTYVGVIAPDHGAIDRATRAAEAMGVPVYRAEKKRDFATGKLSGFGMVDELPSEGKLLLVDDICDGGGTFIGLADAIGLEKERLDLWVTHGIFSKGLSDLALFFGRVHTTDSYFPVSNSPVFYAGHSEDPWRNCHSYDRDLLVVHKLTPYLYGEIGL